MGFIQTTVAALQRFMDRVTPLLNKIVVFFLILFLGFLVGKILGRLVRKLLTDVKADGLSKHLLGTRISVERGVGTILSVIVYAASILLALNVVGITRSVIEALLFIFVLAFLISAFLALKDLTPNFLAGLALRQQKRLKPGVHIRMEGLEGTILEIGLFETLVETRGSDTLIVPNALFRKREVKILRRKPTPEQPKTAE